MIYAFPNIGVTFLGSDRGLAAPSPAGVTMGVFRLPTDPIGVATGRFLDVHSGSEIRVSLADMTELAGVESCDNDHVLTWSVFASGSPNNVVRIVIIHPDYKIKEFTYLSQIGNQSIPVQQEPDKWYSNPA